MLKVTSKNLTTLPTEMLPEFKDHLRILDAIEDDLIQMYLAGAIDAISTFGDIDIFLTAYEYEKFAADEPIHNSTFWQCGKNDIRNVKILDKDDVDVTDSYTIDERLGYFAPALGEDETIQFQCGYTAAVEVLPNLKTIIYRYGAHLFEDRESIKIGDPKQLPDWVNFALASIWVARV